MDIHQLAPDEPLSPELVLVFSPELRAQALARLGPPVWPTPRRRLVEVPAPGVPEPIAPSLGALDEPSSPELVLVFSPELRAQAIARLDPPVWPTPRRRLVEAPAPGVPEPIAPSVGALLVARVGQLALIFVAVTILVLVMSIVANAMR